MKIKRYVNKEKLSLILKLCWLLEDIADKLTFNHADWFYPSRYFEDRLLK